MSGSIDNPVVKMTFDNASFQKNVEGTMSSLDKLKEKLSFKGSQKGLEDVSTAASKVNLSPLGVQVEGISTKFFALATVAATVLSGITSKAFSAGAEIVKSLSLQPVIDGYKEYETNIGSIQTILANTESKGSTLQDVNNALDQLNDYSDKTIYNFSEMTKNIGTFTAAGVDLDTSVSSIKGIANLAAISGSTSAQASTAMYQLSQAIAAGSLKLMDWNSVVNAGMGGEVFKSALFETGKAMKTITDVPLDMSFTEWEAAGNSFRDSLQDGWITADVLTTTLGGLSGELDGAALSAKGFSDEQIVAIQKTADTATKAATEVKTASQLFQTIKESIGSGWAQSFRTVVGDFIEAKQLFSGLYSFVNGFIQRSSTARNDLLNGWKFLGGRDVLVQGLLYSLKAVETALAPIKDAFRAVFPPATGFTLLDITTKFRDFAQKLIISGDTANKVKGVFSGFFSIIKIGVEIAKGIFSVFTSIAKIFLNLGGSVLSAGSGVGNFITRLQQMLVEGGGIAKFFAFVNSGVEKFGSLLISAKDKITSLFSGGVPGGDQAAGIFGKIKDAFSGFSEVGDKVKSVFKGAGDGVSSFFDKVKNVFTKAGQVIGDFFSSIGDKIKSVFTADAFEPILKSVGVGLLGGLTVAFAKFVKDGLKLDFGQSGLFDSIIGLFDQLTGTLKTFQSSIRADMLLKIAFAMAVLAGSILLLSLIDGAKIAASLTALAVGMAQIVAALAVLSKIESNPAKLAALAIAMGLIGLAAVGLAISVRILSGLSWGELAKGLVGVLGALQLMTMATEFLGKNNGSFIKAGISLIVLSGALWLFSKVVASFAQMKFGDLAKGLFGIAAALGMFALIGKNVDAKDMVKLGVGLVGFSVGLGILYFVVEKFGGLDWDTLLKGFVGLGAGLAIMVIAMKNLPKGPDLAGKAVGMLALAATLYIISIAVERIGALDFGSLAKGILGLSVVMLLLVVASKAMQDSVIGAAAMLVLAGALWIFSEVLMRLGELSIGQIVTALGAIAGVLIVLGLAAAGLAAFPPLLGALVGLGIALIAIGAGFALFGAGAYLAAKGLSVLGDVGKESINKLIDVLNAVASAIPGFAKKFAEGFISFAQVLADGANDLMDAIGELLTKMLDKVIELTPKIAEAIGGITVKAIEWMRAHIPEFITLGFELLIAFLTGVRDNIELITTIAIDILVNFINGLKTGIPALVQAATDLIVTFINAIAAGLPQIIQAGVNLLTQLINGIASAIGQIVSAVGNIVTTFITAMIGQWGVIAQSGTDALVQFISGITNNIQRVIDTGADMIVKLIDGIESNISRVVTKGKDATLKFLDGLADNTIDFAGKAGDIVIKLLNGLSEAIETRRGEFQAAGRRLAFAIADGFTGGLASKVGDVVSGAVGLAGKAIAAFKDKIESKSPSKVFKRLGGYIVDGLALGLGNSTKAEKASATMAEATIKAFNESLKDISGQLSVMDQFNPTITPVLDLSNVQKDAKSLNGILGVKSLAPAFSYGSALYISGTQSTNSSDAVAATQGPTSVTFEQVINSPVALATSDIYRATRSQIALAKEKLRIPNA